MASLVLAIILSHISVTSCNLHYTYLEFSTKQTGSNGNASVLCFWGTKYKSQLRN